MLYIEHREYLRGIYCSCGAVAVINNFTFCLRFLKSVVNHQSDVDESDVLMVRVIQHANTARHLGQLFVDKLMTMTAQILCPALELPM